MDFNGMFVLYLIVALVTLVLTMKVDGWIAKLIFFIIALGAANLAMIDIALGSGWVLLINAVLVLGTGLRTVLEKSTGNRVMGIVFIILGAFSLFPAITSLGTETPGTVWDAIVRSFQQGWASLMNIFQNVSGGT